MSHSGVLARGLQPGLYHPVITEGTVSFVEPGAPNDYFATDAARLSEFKEPGPLTPYWRFGEDFVIAERKHAGGVHRALVTSVVVPLHDPSGLDPDRVRFWAQRYREGSTLTALAVSVIDSQFAVLGPHDKLYPYDEQILYTHCLFDGHHRLQAAAELGVSVRILAFIARDFSLVCDDDLLTVLRGYTHKLR